MDYQNKRKFKKRMKREKAIKVWFNRYKNDDHPIFRGERKPRRSDATKRVHKMHRIKHAKILATASEGLKKMLRMFGV